ncbi:arsenate reductase (thioredoxin) [Amylolactobacillus amylotrophicus DSM 20534]|nr:arsenate reductase (thioredoxin) [Amylolactobacillus amylotrophicus DSM 20534]KRM42811.1 arsenate reductase (thioredoxin) [Amylolactobacillus amylophilus DSM 20533 = JCM 1125]GED79674.1 arsenate reductase [Amylolactobacillus amylophilus]
MAEGFAKKILGSDWRVASAGVEVHGLNPRAVEVMAESGVDISKNVSTLIDGDYLMSSDLVVTLCGDARDRCPATPANIVKEHWPVADPAQATGTESEIMAAFRSARDEIEQRLLDLQERVAKKH